MPVPWNANQIMEKAPVVIWRDTVAAGTGREPDDGPATTVAAARERRHALLQQRQHIQRPRASLHLCPGAGCSPDCPAQITFTLYLLFADNQTTNCYGAKPNNIKKPPD